MERRGRIPVAKFRTQEAKTRSRSRVREPDYNEQDPETDLFTLLEDNIALKEENKALKLEIDEQKKAQMQQSDKNTQMANDMENLRRQYSALEGRIRVMTMQNKELELEISNKINEMHLQQMSFSEHKGVKAAEPPKRVNVIESADLKMKILKILPETQCKSNDLESLLDMESTHSMTITKEMVESLVDAFLAQRNFMNGIELQLYEANEKISELIENQTHLEEENENLRNENANLTKVAKLLTENMKESVETSKKMEAALIKLKQRNDELAAKSRDNLDGPTYTSQSAESLKETEELSNLQDDIDRQNQEHNERIVEMKSLMEAAIEKSTNDELRTLQLKLEVLEEELRKALARAEYAENELKKLKLNEQTDSDFLQYQNSIFNSNYEGTSSTFKNLTSRFEKNSKSKEAPLTTPTPPPPPPPLPATLLYKATNINACSSGGGSFNSSIAMRQLHSSNGSKVIENVKHHVQPEVATGLDALVRELKSGRVTLRRNRRVTQTNEAIKEMFQVLEISHAQNRNSKICIDMHI